MSDDLPDGLEEPTDFDIEWPHHSDTLHPTNYAGVVIAVEGRRMGEFRRVEGFKMAACILADRLLEGHRPDESLLYPFALAWRHHIELQLKELIADSSALYGDEPPARLESTHSLGSLWGIARTYILQTFPDDDSADVSVPNRIIGQLASLDPDGSAFRYSQRRDGRSTVHGTPLIDVASFQNALMNLSAYLNGAIEGTAWLSDQQPDWDDGFY